MNRRTVIYFRATKDNPEPLLDLHRIIEAQGDVVVATYFDDRRIDGKGRNSGWRRLMRNLDQIDRIVVECAGDFPGSKVIDLLATLSGLAAQGVSVAAGNIDTSTGATAVLDLISVYRLAKRSEAIKRGQNRGRMLGRHIGRPPIPEAVRRRITATLREGFGTREAARRHDVSPAFIVSVRKSLVTALEPMAA